MTGWKKKLSGILWGWVMNFKPLSELLEIPLRNGLTKPKKIRGSGVKMVNMGELFKYPRMNNIPMDRAPLTEREVFTSLLSAGDLLFARQSLVREGAGKCSVFLHDDEPVFFESHLIRCRLDAKKCNPLFYYYYFDSPSGKQAVDTIIEQGAGAAGIRGSDLAKLNIPAPSVDFQDDVVSILDAIDQKVEINHRSNQTLEQIAQALFKSWFVDFEPIKAKIAERQRWQALQPENEASSPVCYAAELEEQPAVVGDLDTWMNRAAMQAISGKTPDQLDAMRAEDPERYNELYETAALFPSAMQESELGEIPEGWSAPELREQTKALRGFSYKGKGLSDSGVPMHNLNSVLEGGGYKYSGIKHYSLDFKEKFEVVPGDVLVANTEQGHEHLLIGYGATVPSFYGRSIFSHHLYRVRPSPSAVVTREFLAMLFKERGFVARVQGFSNGTTVNMLPMAGVEMPRFVCPSRLLVDKFSGLVSPYVTMAENNYLENKSLISLRDSLLPKLLSGEISFSNRRVS